MSFKVGDHVEMLDDTDHNVPKFTKGIIRRIFRDDAHTTSNLEFPEFGLLTGNYLYLMFAFFNNI